MPAFLVDPLHIKKGEIAFVGLPNTVGFCRHVRGTSGRGGLCKTPLLLRL